MKKRVIIVHGWDGYPEEGWFPWLKKELEHKSFEILTPRLPSPENPKINEWVSTLSKTVGTLDENTYFVGHSMGCQTIIRYLETLSGQAKIAGAVFVGGWLNSLTGLDDPEDQKMGNYWLNTPIDFQKVKNHISKCVAIFSDDDPYVPLDNQDDFRDKLGSKIIIEHNMGHFSGSNGIIKLPVVLDTVLEISK